MTEVTRGAQHLSRCDSVDRRRRQRRLHPQASFHLQVEDLGFAATGFGDQLFEEDLQNFSAFSAQLTLHLDPSLIITKKTRRPVTNKRCSRPGAIVSLNPFCAKHIYGFFHILRSFISFRPVCSSSLRTLLQPFLDIFAPAPESLHLSMPQLLSFRAYSPGCSSVGCGHFVAPCVRSRKNSIWPLRRTSKMMEKNNVKKKTSPIRPSWKPSLSLFPCT